MGNDMNKEDWKKFDALTDDDITTAIADDPDWQGVSFSDKLGWRVVRPDGSAIFPITLDAKLTRFVQDTHFDYQKFLVGVLKDYAEREQKTT